MATRKLLLKLKIILKKNLNMQFLKPKIYDENFQNIVNELTSKLRSI